MPEPIQPVTQVYTPQKGKVLIFSAPSGSGKTTVVRHLLDIFPNLGFSVSACTRKPREYEQEAVDYYFLSIDDFKQKIANQDLVEWQEVYENSFYGTLKTEIDRIWASGKHVIFDVDVKGGLNLKKYFGEKALSVFIAVPQPEKTLASRLVKRNTETSEMLEQRLAKIMHEITYEDMFEVRLLNENLQKTLLEAEVLVQNFINDANTL